MLQMYKIFTTFEIGMTEICDTYRSVAARGEGIYKELGSRFLAFAFPVETEDEVKEFVDALRVKYHDARHHCYAYRLGQDGSRFRANDDGEPSSSAGRPILGQIDSAGLSDTLVVVVRYFGGIKLGIPGLVRAYRTAAAEAIASSGTVEKVSSRAYRLCFDYLQMNQVMRVLKDMSIPQSRQIFEQLCSIDVKVRLGSDEIFRERVSNISSCILREL